ncbi:MAG: TlpA disulfide reductase family protein, partial [Blastocatellia bacterium]
MKRLVFILVAIILVTAFAVHSPAATRDRAGATTLEGQIVCCADCWVKADRKTTPYGTAADLAQAVQCIANGDPTLLAVTNSAGATTFYQLESGKFKRPGKSWLDFVGKRVEIAGSIRSRKATNYIKVDALRVISVPHLSSGSSQTSVIGSEAELTLKDLSGVEQRLSAYRGRIVVLNFWATYCIPCRKEMPDLASVQN